MVKKGSDFILEIYKRPETVFSFRELSLIFPKLSYQSLKNKANYFTKAGKLKRLRKGIYAKENYEPFELANKLYTPSYISFETVLREEGIIFQKYSTIFIASYLTRKLEVGGHELFYRKLKDSVLYNESGIRRRGGFFIAEKERAFLDAVFLYKDYHFDNLCLLDWKRVMNMAGLYQSKALIKRLQDYYRIYKDDVNSNKA
jgi:predicted transcriptional regulator of viral defense system